ncbi:MAG: N-glycosylase/DNA lyase [Thermosphaera aggregans]|jgi:DNA-(apurinic or apyrimidinic site) lyase|uniref:N-glycosylase/DNA lyase n=1 Tax=Thermosphaera aggregans TaxID=54254 RepID=UPI003C068BA5
MRTKVMHVDSRRARELSGIFKQLAPFVEVVERSDPQYRAVEKLTRIRGCDQAAVLVIANALVSYQLNVRGEEYWQYFVDHTAFVKDSPEQVMIDFLSHNKYNKRLLRQKMARVKSFFRTKLYRELITDGLKYCSSLESLRDFLLKELSSSQFSKTVLFAVKMYNYVCSSCGREVKGDVDLPIDLRNATLSVWSCIVKGCSGDVHVCAEKLMREPLRTLLINAWRIVCRESGIPCVKLDALTWLITGLLRDSGLNPVEARRRALETLGIEIPVEALKELVKCAGESY